MIYKKDNAKNYLLFIIGIPALLLIFSLSEEAYYGKVIVKNDFNPYIKTLPNKYARGLSNNLNQNDSTFFYSVIENYGIRELIILKTFPSYSEKNTDFSIKLYTENNKESLVLNVTNSAGLFNFKEVTYGVYQKALPYINIDKIEIKEKVTNKKHKPWEVIIEKPFKLLHKQFDIEQITGNKFKSVPNPYTSVFTSTLKFYDISFSPYNYSIENDSLLQTTLNLNNYTKEKEVTIGIIEKPTKFWKLFNKKDNTATNFIKFKGKDSSAVALITSFLKEEINFEAVFDVNKMAYFSAIKSVFSNNCEENLYFIYNDKSNLIEPFFLKSSCLGQTLKSIIKPSINDTNYTEAYINALDELSQLNIYEDVLNTIKTFETEMGLINKFDSKNTFSYDVLELNQRVIKKSLNPTALVLPEIISFVDKKMEILVHNFSVFPIHINALNFNPKKQITSLEFSQQISGNSKDTIIINLPRSFENLFVNKKSKKTGFNLYKHIYDLNISYSISNLNKKYYTSIAPFLQDKKIEDDLFRMTSKIELQQDISINEGDKKITFNKKNITINTPLIIPKGYEFVVKSGTKIDIVNGGKIISHAPLGFNGTKENPIVIFSSDKKGQGMLVLSEGKQSNLQHVVFDNLTNLEHGYWNISGAVTFYESPVNLNYVTISNNTCEDALNIVRTTFNMINCTIVNTQSDAFDGDFVTGTIRSSKFNYLGNDAIDISGSDLKIIDVQISNAGDKGLSAGENSKMTVNNVTITISEIAIASKDLSIINANNIIIKNTKLGFTAFQKKPEFGPSNITVNKIEMDNVQIKYLIENTSSLIVDEKKIETSKNVKDRMYGAEFGVSSSETRKKQ